MEFGHDGASGQSAMLSAEAEKNPGPESAANLNMVAKTVKEKMKKCYSAGPKKSARVRRTNFKIKVR
jgi:hypothetical protein